MCITRQWKQLEASSANSSVSITARRSDGFLVKISTSFYPEELENIISRKVVALIKKLESYRNCKCSLEQSPCEVHK